MEVEEAQEMVDRARRLSQPGVEVITPKAAVETISLKRSKEKSRSSTYVENQRPPGMPPFMPLRVPSPSSSSSESRRILEEERSKEELE
eukprot:12430461-Karenia_brevis.AAC.1